MSVAANDKKKLRDIHDKIVEAQEQLKLKDIFHKNHKATASELLSRYDFLQSQLKDEVQDMEQHGHHVSSLEKSVLDWVNGLEFDR